MAKNPDSGRHDPVWLRVPPLHTTRLLIRELAAGDLDDIHRILDLEIDAAGGLSLDARRRWLEWSMASYREHANLYQPPYGERAVALRETGELIGAVGYSPMFHPLAEMLAGKPAHEARWLPEMGLYYALSAAHRGQGYATEAARALVDYAFEHFNLKRIVANTDFDNPASRRVMERIGMTIYRNDAGAPGWFQILGVVERE